MEASNNQDGMLFGIYEKTRTWVSATLGILVTILGIAVVFTIASLEGTKEIKATGGDNAKIIQLWRDNHEGGFPQERADVISYNGKEYYFVVDKFNEDTGDILKWHFAYDGGIDYIYKDYKYWVMTLLAFLIGLFVSHINYIQASKNAKETSKFTKTLKHYQENKDKVQPFTQYIPDFCIYKNKQAYETAKRDIIEEAGVNYQLYIKDKINKKELEKWQIKALNKIKKIKVKKIHSSDLLQEQGYTSTRIALLPTSEKEHQRTFLISGGLQKLLTSGLSGLVVAFGVVIGNWWLGIAYGFGILLGAISAIFIATDFVTNGLRNRYIAKADLLNEFYNIKQRFIDEEEQVKKQDIND